MDIILFFVIFLDYTSKIELKVVVIRLFKDAVKTVLANRSVSYSLCF